MSIEDHPNMMDVMRERIIRAIELLFELELQPYMFTTQKSFDGYTIDLFKGSRNPEAVEAYLYHTTDPTSVPEWEVEEISSVEIHILDHKSYYMFDPRNGGIFDKKVHMVLVIRYH